MKWVLMVFTLIVLMVCIVFFWTAFDRTMDQCEHETPVIQFSVENDCLSNAVLQVVSTDTVKEITEIALTDREQIVEKEHTRFRAELATWLSVFGLLTILVALITPICSLVFQQKEFERLQKLIDSQSQSIEEIKAKQTEIVQTAKQVEDASKQVEDARLYVSNEKDSNDADIAEHTQQENPEDPRSLLYSFKGIWGKDRVKEKIDAGIKLFDKCNTMLSNAIAGRDNEGLKNCLNVLNNANAYLGMKNLAEFRDLFSQRMQIVRPLKLSNDIVMKALENGGFGGLPITGFYNSALSLQESPNR